MLLKDGKSIAIKEACRGLIPYPALDSSSFELSEHVTSALFYGEETFALSNSYFVSAWMDKDTLVLRYAHDEVRIEGQGLHTLFVNFSQFRILKVVAKAERYQKGEAVFVRSIKRRKRKNVPANNSSEDESPEGNGT